MATSEGWYSPVILDTYSKDGGEALGSYIEPTRDYNFTYVGIKRLRIDTL